MVKEMKICDFCGRVLNGEPKSVTIDGAEYKDVCMSCVGRLDTFVKRLGTPYVPKAKKEGVEVVSETSTPPQAVEEGKAPLFGKSKK
ncbi:MAG: hypothetical protein CVV47_07075 [Spirochaetae bacterium HGW-Spirochaetae-3]|jgi:ribosome-binding protein aMBF1 (putative translation factor)|nr:MAG: hypothetical protein CVV47_07075 [Spirochaetae bacterium HGW-Spirochaetae-3]